MAVRLGLCCSSVSFALEQTCCPGCWVSPESHPWAAGAWLSLSFLPLSNHQDKGLCSLVVAVLEKTKLNLFYIPILILLSAVLTLLNVVGDRLWYLKRINVLHIHVKPSVTTTCLCSHLHFFLILWPQAPPSASPVTVPSFPLPSTDCLHWAFPTFPSHLIK